MNLIEKFGANVNSLWEGTDRVPRRLEEETEHLVKKEPEAAISIALILIVAGVALLVLTGVGVLPGGLMFGPFFSSLAVLSISAGLILLTMVAMELSKHKGSIKENIIDKAHEIQIEPKDEVLRDNVEGNQWNGMIN